MTNVWRNRDAGSPDEKRQSGLQSQPLSPEEPRKQCERDRIGCVPGFLSLEVGVELEKTFASSSSGHSKMTGGIPSGDRSSDTKT